MSIRLATSEDIKLIDSLFTNTVRLINARDYSAAQIEVWSTITSEKTWAAKIQQQYFIVCEKNGKLLGFSSIDPHGYLDYMYVDVDHQNKGIASGLLNSILNKATDQQNKVVWASVSKTAKPFFSKKGFKTVREESKCVQGIWFVNYIMEKVI